MLACRGRRDLHSNDLLATRESARGAFSSPDEKQGRESVPFAQLAVSDARSASLTSDYLSLEIKHFLQGLRFMDYMMKVAKKAVQVYHFFSYPNNCRNTACTFVPGFIPVERVQLP